MDPMQDRWARFGVFEADLREGTLTKSGRSVPIQEQPFRVLVRLLRQPETLVTREEVREAVWPGDMTVDFERGLNTAVNKLRTALADSADSPRFVETVPRRGYRFLQPVEWHGDGAETPRKTPPRRFARATSSGRWLAAGFALVLLVGVGLWTLSRIETTSADAAGDPRLMLAVLPFEDLSGSAGQEYLSAGLTEEMISRLGGIAPSQLGVLARSTVMAYRDRKRPIRDLGAEFGADYVLEGSVRRDGDHIRITAQLVSVDDETHLWTETYDSGLGDVLSTQGRIASRISNSLALDVLPVTAASPPIDPEVYEAYLKGLHYRDMLTEDGYRKATTEFSRALELDPDFAPALASMSACYCLLSGHGLEIDLPADLMTRTRELATKALALDPNLAEAHGTLGMALLKYDWDWPAAERELRLATEINPSDPMAAVWYSFYLSSQGRHADAIEQSEKARRSDPISRITTSNLAWQYYEARRYEEAIAAFDAALALFPTLWVGNWGRGLTRLRLGNVEGAMSDLVRAVALSNGSPHALGALSYAHAVIGDEARSTELLDVLVDRAQGEYVPPAIFVPIHAELGHLDRAFESLQKAYEMRSRSIVWINVSHDFDALRSDPRFHAIVRKMGLPDRGDL